MNTLQYRGTEIKVEFTEETHYFELTENGVVTRIIVNAPSVSDTVKQITLNSTVQKLDNLGNVIAPAISQKKLFDDLATYTKWYNYTFAGIGGVFWFAPSFNGVLSEYFKDENLYCFNPLNNFTFFQPVIFDVVATETTATANVVDGTGTIEFSINGTDWQESNIFNGLTEGTEYTIHARNTVDLWESKVKFTTLIAEENE